MCNTVRYLGALYIRGRPLRRRNCGRAALCSLIARVERERERQVFIPLWCRCGMEVCDTARGIYKITGFYIRSLMQARELAAAGKESL